MIGIFKKRNDGSYDYYIHYGDNVLDETMEDQVKNNGFEIMDCDLFEECEDHRMYLKTDIGNEQYLANMAEHKKLVDVMNAHNYLYDTDYVISKLNELQLEDEEEYEKAKAEYAEVLAKRKEARKTINELEPTITY